MAGESCKSCSCHSAVSSPFQSCSGKRRTRLQEYNGRQAALATAGPYVMLWHKQLKHADKAARHSRRVHSVCMRCIQLIHVITVSHDDHVCTYRAYMCSLHASNRYYPPVCVCAACPADEAAVASEVVQKVKDTAAEVAQRAQDNIQQLQQLHTDAAAYVQDLDNIHAVLQQLVGQCMLQEQPKIVQVCWQG
jgi:hypothetical protein